MPSKKKKYNARFPPARIKKIMQSDEDVGKVAQAVPVIISRALELFVESLLKKAEVVTQARNAKTLTPSHLKQCIMSEQRFDFLRDLVSSVSDVQGDEDNPEPNTPRPTGNTGEHSFVFQSQNQGPSTSSLSSTATTATSGTPSVDPQQQQTPEYMMSLQNPLQQHYIKQDEITTKNEQIYIPSTPSAPGGAAMTRGQLPYSPIISQPQQSPGVIINNHPYIPSGAAIHPPQHSQHQQQQPQHFFYSQYDSTNGSVKVDTVVHSSDGMNRHYSDHGDQDAAEGYDYAREPQRHHY